MHKYILFKPLGKRLKNKRGSSELPERQDIVGHFISGIPVCLGEIHVEFVLDRYYLEGE